MDAYSDIINALSSKPGSGLESILHYMGCDERLNGTTTDECLEELKNTYGISNRMVELKNAWYTDNMLPLLIEYKGEPVAVLPNYRGRCFYIGKKGRVRITEENAGGFAKTALCFYKGFREKKISKTGLLKYMLSCVKSTEYAAVIAAAAATAVFSLVFPQVQYYMFRDIIPSGARGGIDPLLHLLLAIAAVSLALNIFKRVTAANISLVISANFQGALLSRLLELKPSFFSENRSGSLSQNITRFSDVSDIISGETAAALLSFLLSVVYLIAIACYIPQFLGLTVFTFIGALLLNTVNAVLTKKHISELYKKSNEMTGFVYELFGGMENIKLNNSEDNMLGRWTGYYSDVMKVRKKPFFLRYYNTIYMLFAAVCVLLIYIAGMKSDVSAASFIAFVSLYGLFTLSLGGIVKVFESFARFNMAYGRLEGFLNAETEKNVDKVKISSVESGIEFSNVCYAYPGCDKNVLEDISFTLKKGMKLGIVGKSGCGKSTLIKLLLRFETPQSGRIFIDNKDINEIDLKSYRQNLGVVLQTTKLIPADIYSNLTLTNMNAAPAEIDAALEAVGLKEDTDKMSMGLQTFVSESNMTISQGQKQRILLARAILGKPSMLVLDEATSALDNITQENVTDFIEKSDITAVIAAHRLSTIKQCDSIILLDAGHIAEQGTYEELIGRKGLFYELVRNQL